MDSRQNEINMHDIEVLIIERERKDRPSSVICQRERLLPPAHALKEINEYGLNGTVKKVSIDDLSKKIEANLIVILDEDTYITEDFVNRIVSFNNLFRDAGILCGPIFPTLESRFSKSYYTYDLKFGSSVVSDISKEENSYPSMIGCVITGQAYSKYLYRPVKGPRHTSADNMYFLTSLCQEYKIYYSPALFKARYLDKSDIELNVLSDYYYNLGYQDGLAVSSKTKLEKHQALFDRFVNSPEMFDNTMPRWLFEESAETNGDYAEMLVLVKCKYQIGFYEGMLDKKVI